MFIVNQLHLDKTTLSEGRQGADMHIREFADDQEDSLILLYTLAEIDLRGDLVAPLAELYQKIMETPLGQNLVLHLSRTKASFTRTKPFISEALYLMVIAQNLSEQVVMAYKASPTPKTSCLSDRVIPETVEYV
jgi:hypothetical protein